ncbi:MAG: hypothetical protein ACYCQJ_06175 [Nitrososphaerales archaeon]
MNDARKDQSELYNFIDTALEDISKAAEKHNVSYLPVKFKVAVVEVRQAGGGIKIIVADAGAKYEKEKITTIDFECNRKPEPASRPAL